MSSDALVRCFRQIDTDGNGFIYRLELASVLQELKPTYWTNERLDLLMQEADRNGDSAIDYSEFVAWVFKPDPLSKAFRKTVNLPLSKSALEDQRAAMEAFRTWDLGAKGFIEGDELRKIIGTVCGLFSEEIDDVIQGIALNADGHVGYDEFTRWLFASAPTAILDEARRLSEARELPIVQAKKDGHAPIEDPFDLRRRFCRTHCQYFDTALEEIETGKKRSCWSWYIFPVAPFVVDGVEKASERAKEYALRDPPPNNLQGDEAARAYLEFEADGINLRTCYMRIMAAVAEQLESGVEPVRLVGALDDPKLRSSLRLFERVSRDSHTDVNSVCKRALLALKEPID